MDGIICNTCGKDMKDEQDIYTCLSCGGVMCKKDFEITTGFCQDCSAKGLYHEC